MSEEQKTNEQDTTNDTAQEVNSSIPSDTSNMTILTNIFTSPAQAMTQVQERYNVVFPLMLLLVSSALVFMYYFMAVDYQWYIDHTVELTAGELSKSEQEATRSALSMMSQNTMGIITAVSVVIITAIMLVIQAVYFVIVSNITNDGYQFKQWMSFNCWASMPALVVFLAMAATMLFSGNGQVALESANPLSLNELIFGLDPTKGAGKLLASLDLTKFWAMYIMVIGYQKWTGKSLQTSLLIALLPFIMIYGIWALMM